MNKKEIKYQSNGQPVAVNFEDLKEKLGYRTYKPRVGSLGKALVKAIKGKDIRSIGWLKHQLDIFFKKNRQNFKKDRNVKNKE